MRRTGLIFSVLIVNSFSYFGNSSYGNTILDRSSKYEPNVMESHNGNFYKSLNNQNVECKSMNSNSSAQKDDKVRWNYEAADNSHYGDNITQNFSGKNIDAQSTKYNPLVPPYNTEEGYGMSVNRHYNKNFNDKNIDSQSRDENLARLKSESSSMNYANKFLANTSGMSDKQSTRSYAPITKENYSGNLPKQATNDDCLVKQNESVTHPKIPVNNNSDVRQSSSTSSENNLSQHEVPLSQEVSEPTNNKTRSSEYIRQVSKDGNSVRNVSSNRFEVNTSGKTGLRFFPRFSMIHHPIMDLLEDLMLFGVPMPMMEFTKFDDLPKESEKEVINPENNQKVALVRSDKNGDSTVVAVRCFDAYTMEDVKKYATEDVLKLLSDYHVKEIYKNLAPEQQPINENKEDVKPIAEDSAQNTSEEDKSRLFREPINPNRVGNVKPNRVGNVKPIAEQNVQNENAERFIPHGFATPNSDVKSLSDYIKNNPDEEYDLQDRNASKAWQLNYQQN